MHPVAIFLFGSAAGAAFVVCGLILIAVLRDEESNTHD